MHSYKNEDVIHPSLFNHQDLFISRRMLHEVRAGATRLQSLVPGWAAISVSTVSISRYF